jgi:hypothetical protein
MFIVSESKHPVVVLVCVTMYWPEMTVGPGLMMVNKGLDTVELDNPKVGVHIYVLLAVDGPPMESLKI